MSQGFQAPGLGQEQQYSYAPSLYPPQHAGSLPNVNISPQTSIPNIPNGPHHTPNMQGATNVSSWSYNQAGMAVNNAEAVIRDEISQTLADFEEDAQIVEVVNEFVSLPA